MWDKIRSLFVKKDRKLRIINGAMALDGGSIILEGIDIDGKEINFYLDWSIESGIKGTYQFSVNDVPIEKLSPEQDDWINRLKQAEIIVKNKKIIEAPGKRLISTNDLYDYILSYFDISIDNFPKQPLQHLVNNLIDKVTSEQYTYVPKTIKGSMLEGNKLEAIRLYRSEHPSSTMQEAKAAVEDIMSQMD